MKEILEKLMQISYEKENEIPNRFMKLIEEVGEASQMALAFQRNISASESKKAIATRENVLEELVDVLIVAFDIYIQMSDAEDWISELEEIMNKKLEKWQRKATS